MLAMQNSMNTGSQASGLTAPCFVLRSLRFASSIKLHRAAVAIYRAKALIFTSGAGMGVDSGLPVFRSSEGFWNAYPSLRERGITIHSMSRPHWFEDDPRFAWGFFGHRYHMYKKAEPHEGYNIILNWGRQMELGYFAFTSNVDGHLHKSDFHDNHIVECHGSINFLQCVDTSVNSAIWPVAADAEFDVDEDLKLKTALPTGPPGSNHPARPNIFMFRDHGWQSGRTAAQEERFKDFCKGLYKEKVPFVVIEVGAGTTVPTVRCESEWLVRNSSGHGTLIRINPTEPEVPPGHIGLPMGGFMALQHLNEVYETVYT